MLSTFKVESLIIDLYMSLFSLKLILNYLVFTFSLWRNCYLTGELHHNMWHHQGYGVNSHVNVFDTLCDFHSLSIYKVEFVAFFGLVTVLV